MTKRSDFAALFPKSARRFTDGAPDLYEWTRADETGRMRLWRVYLEAEALLVYVASYRQSEDLFRRPRFWGRLYALWQEIWIMAGKKATEPVRDDVRAEWKGFIDFRLTEGQLQGLDDWKPKPQDIWNCVDGLIGDGYRLTLSYNKRTKLATCTIIDDDPTRKTGGFALSSADVDGALALKMAIYKHSVLLENDWLHVSDIPQKSRRG